MVSESWGLFAPPSSFARAPLGPAAAAHAVLGSHFFPRPARRAPTSLPPRPAPAHLASPPVSGFRPLSVRPKKPPNMVAGGDPRREPAGPALGRACSPPRAGAGAWGGARAAGTYALKTLLEFGHQLEHLLLRSTRCKIVVCCARRRRFRRAAPPRERLPPRALIWHQPGSAANKAAPFRARGAATWPRAPFARRAAKTPAPRRTLSGPGLAALAWPPQTGVASACTGPSVVWAARSKPGTL